MDDLKISITFPIADPASFKIESDIKEDSLLDVLSDCLRSQFGQGADTKKPEIRDIYEIEIFLDLPCDKFTICSNTGNKGLTTGILMHVVKMLGEREIKNSTNIAITTIGKEQQ